MIIIENNSEEGELPEELVDIAKRQGDETYESIANLDQICHMSIIAIAFVISALGAWWAVVMGWIGVIPFAREVFIALTVACAAFIGLSIYRIVQAIMPRAFWGDNVGDTFITSMWRPWGRTFWPPWESKGEGGKEMEERREIAKGSIEEKKSKFRLKWLKEKYGVEKPEDLQLARFWNLKYIAMIKANNTAHGVAWLRLAVITLIILIIVGLSGYYVSTVVAV